MQSKCRNSLNEFFEWNAVTSLNDSLRSKILTYLFLYVQIGSIVNKIEDKDSTLLSLLWGDDASDLLWDSSVKYRDTLVLRAGNPSAVERKKNMC